MRHKCTPSPVSALDRDSEVSRCGANLGWPRHTPLPQAPSSGGSPSLPQPLPVLNQPSEVNAFFVSSGLPQYSRNTVGPLTKSSPSFSLNPGVTCGVGEKCARQSNASQDGVSTCLPCAPARPEDHHAFLKLNILFGD